VVLQPSVVFLSSIVVFQNSPPYAFHLHLFTFNALNFNVK
jgi:hypothetical protein